MSAEQKARSFHSPSLAGFGVLPPRSPNLPREARRRGGCGFGLCLCRSASCFRTGLITTRCSSRHCIFYSSRNSRQAASKGDLAAASVSYRRSYCRRELYLLKQCWRAGAVCGFSFVSRPVGRGRPAGLLSPRPTRDDGLRPGFIRAALRCGIAAVCYARSSPPGSEHWPKFRFVRSDAATRRLSPYRGRLMYEQPPRRAWPGRGEAPPWAPRPAMRCVNKIDSSAPPPQYDRPKVTMTRSARRQATRRRPRSSRSPRSPPHRASGIDTGPRRVGGLRRLGRGIWADTSARRWL